MRGRADQRCLKYGIPQRSCIQLLWPSWPFQGRMNRRCSQCCRMCTGTRRQQIPHNPLWGFNSRLQILNLQMIHKQTLPFWLPYLVIVSLEAFLEVVYDGLYFLLYPWGTYPDQTPSHPISITHRALIFPYESLNFQVFQSFNTMHHLSEVVSQIPNTEYGGPHLRLHLLDKGVNIGDLGLQYGDYGSLCLILRHL